MPSSDCQGTLVRYATLSELSFNSCCTKSTLKLKYFDLSTSETFNQIRFKGMEASKRKTRQDWHHLELGRLFQRKVSTAADNFNQKQNCAVVVKVLRKARQARASKFCASARSRECHEEEEQKYKKLLEKIRLWLVCRYLMKQSEVTHPVKPIAAAA